MNNFADSARVVSNLTTTENGAIALKSTRSALVDLFGSVGALRVKSTPEIRAMFNNAFQEDSLLATKLMFYARNIRGGLGERSTFRAMLRWLAEAYPEVVSKNLDLIPLFGRWDDLYTLVGTELEKPAFQLISKTINSDIHNMNIGQSVTLCAKWLKSANTSSKASCELGRLTAKNLGLSDRIYRKVLSRLRSYIQLTERKMSSNHWTEIDYSRVPSRAMKNYRKSFPKHDPIGFAKFMQDVEAGKVKINSATLYPYDILIGADLTHSKMMRINRDPVLEAQWKALPNYVDEGSNILVMADTSGSMSGLPMATSVGLAIYFAEHNTGAYKDLFLTFSESPSFVDLSGANSLHEKVSRVPSIVANTNLEKAFDLILGVAIQNNIPQDEMPKALIIISDMQFDAATEYRPAYYGQARISADTFHQSMEIKYHRAGYEMPQIVYWQVEERSKAFQVEHDKNGVVLVSGQGTSVFKSILQNAGKTPYQFMVETLSDPMYDCVKI